MAKKECGRMGGKKTVQRYGRNYMRELAKKSIHVMDVQYMEPTPLYDYVFVDRETGEPTGETICGRKIA